MQMPPPLLPYSSTAIQRRKKLRNPTPTVVFSFPWTVRGKGGSVGGAGGEGETFGALYWFPLAPCIAFAFKASADVPSRKKSVGPSGGRGRGGGPGCSTIAAGYLSFHTFAPLHVQHLPIEVAKSLVMEIGLLPAHFSN